MEVRERGNWLLWAALLVGAVAGTAASVGLGEQSAWLLSGFALVAAAVQAVTMVRRLSRGEFGVDVLAVTAIVSTVLVGESVAAWLVLVMLVGGQALERFAERRAKRELTALVERSPRRAHRVRGDLIEEISVDDVHVGDLLLVRPSDMVPVDGSLTSPAATVDQSLLTGESIPVDLAEGGPVLSGSLNSAAAFRYRATKDAGHSQFQSLVHLVEEAQSRPARMVRLADRYALAFTIVSIAIGVAAWVVSGQPVRFAEVLVLASPCPLIIAAPVALTAGLSRSAKAGVVVKGTIVLERASRARSVFLDKTGTITRGTPEIVDIVTRRGFAASEVLSWAASAEQGSSHVLATTIVAAARERGITPAEAQGFREEPAGGVVATVAGRTVRVGNRAFAGDADSVPVRPGELEIYVSIDGRPAGTIVARDVPRPESAAVIEELRRLGVRRITMLTGDSAPTAERIAETVGVTDVLAERLPAQKVEAVRSETERPVIMVGDGVNDAAVLAVADVGVAMAARGATIASESADAVVLTEDLSRVTALITIARRSVTIAIQSIWLGMVLSVALMLIATTGVIPAVFGAASQELVDLVCILNALRALTGPGARGPSAPPGAVSARKLISTQRFPTGREPGQDGD